MSNRLRSALRLGSPALGLLVASLAGAKAVRAQAGSADKVELRVLGCEPAFAAEVRRIVGLELGGLLHAGPPGESGVNGQLEVRCEPELSRVSARDVRGGQQVDNALRFDAFPGDAAPRAVALAAVEALRSADPTLAARIQAERRAAANDTQAPEPESRPAVPQVAVRSGDAVRASQPRAWTRVLVGPVARRFLSDPHTTVWGARAELSRRSALPLDYGFDLEGALSELDVELGAIDVRLISSSAWLGWRAGSKALSFTAGAGARLGLANLAGSSSSSTVRTQETTRVWTGPIALARGDGTLGAIALAVTLEAGWAAVGAEGLSQQAAVVGVRGGWLALSVSPGVRF